MPNQILSKKDIEYTNLNFWIYYISCFRGFDDEKELNIEDAIKEVVDIYAHTPSFNDWYTDFVTKEKTGEEGLHENSKIITGKLTNDLSFSIEFHLSETTFYLNNYYIGNLGGHFESWFLTLKELLTFDKYEALFLLLLPMAGIEKKEVIYAESLISEKLKRIPIFIEQSDYIAKCIVNGLTIEKDFYNDSQIGIVCDTNHSVRNVAKYPRYKENVIELNKVLKAFIENEKE